MTYIVRYTIYDTGGQEVSAQTGAKARNDEFMARRGCAARSRERSDHGHPEQHTELDRDRRRDPAVPHRDPPGRTGRPARSPGPHPLARRAAGGWLGVWRGPRLREGNGRVLALQLRLAHLGSQAQRLPAIHDDNRRDVCPLPARTLARAQRPAADPHPRLAGLRGSILTSSARYPIRVRTAATRPTPSTW